MNRRTVDSARSRPGGVEGPEDGSTVDDDLGGRADAAPPVEVVFYTDPLCSWSWALLPSWRRLIDTYGDQLTYLYRMGGMIGSWDRYDDPLNSVSKPSQMGPLWFQVQETTGVDLNDRIWMEDPPGSSYPPSVAVKAAELQSPASGENYLIRVWRAVMTECRNVARREVLVELAEELASDSPDVLDVQRFRRDLDGEAAREAFKDDLKEARFREIGRFPTLTFRRPGGRGVIITGFRPYEHLEAVFRDIQS